MEATLVSILAWQGRIRIKRPSLHRSVPAPTSVHSSRSGPDGYSGHLDPRQGLTSSYVCFSTACSKPPIRSGKLR